MAASEHLSPRQFFHGTDVHLPIGAHLLPPAETGKQPRSHPDVEPHEYDNASYVYLTDSEHTARDFAADRGGHHVYAVTPHGPVEPDPETDIHGMPGLYRAARATINKKL